MTTISRLAAVLTTDTSRFDTGMLRAGQSIRRFDTDTTKGGLTLNWLSQRLLISSGSLGRFSGLAAAIGGRTGPIGMLITVFAGVAAAAVAAAAKIAAIGDAARDAKLEALRDHFKAFDDLKGTKFSIGFDAKTNQELVSDIRRSFSDLAEGLGLTLKPLLMAANDLVQQMNSRLLGPELAASLRESHEKAARLAEANKELRAQAKLRAEEEERAIAEIQQHWDRVVDRMRSRADQLKESLRTPAEAFRASLEELSSLRNIGFIDDETLGRGLKSAAADYFDASKKLAEAKNTLTPVAALERGTTAEFSARVRGTLETHRLEAINREQLKLEQQALQELRNLNAKPLLRFGLTDLR
jgi:hypothetical protein